MLWAKLINRKHKKLEKNIIFTFRKYQLLNYYSTIKFSRLSPVLSVTRYALLQQKFALALLKYMFICITTGASRSVLRTTRMHRLTTLTKVRHLALNNIYRKI